MTAVGTAAARAALADFAPRVPCGAKYGPDYAPSEKQRAALSGYANRIREVLYGGAVFGGKSDWLLRAALQYVCVPGYSALLMRQTFPQLTGASGLIPRAFEWLGPSDATWHASHSVYGQNVWEFPSGATLKFGHAQGEADGLKFASDEYQFVGFDELAGWRDAKVYQYVGFARVRHKTMAHGDQPCPTCGVSMNDIPLRTRAGTNPIGPGVPWVRALYQIGYDEPALTPNRLFIPAMLTDNPVEERRRSQYITGLRQGLDPIMLERALHGDWKISEAGRMFERFWFTTAA